MKPKEKAIELVYKHFEFVEALSILNQIENAKQCALITVDELLLLVTYQPTIDYWNEVKTEIKKITL
jgi:hypothetical protein